MTRFSRPVPPSRRLTRATRRNITWAHEKWLFLNYYYIRDKNMKRPFEADYNSKSVHIPKLFLKQQTPTMQQWWSFKRDHFDCVLFFKVGKFFKLFHMDAVTGVKKLGCSFMKGRIARTSFPESAYGRMVSSLVDLGYKVARVEQTETPKAMKKRLQGTRNGSKQSKVVSREICQITNKATRALGLQDLALTQAPSTYLLAICENRGHFLVEFGVCFIDTSIGVFYIGQFEDDERYSRLLTMLTQYPPAVILEERWQLSRAVKTAIGTVVEDVIYESLVVESEFLSTTKTLSYLQEYKYFGRTEDGKTKFPDALQNMIRQHKLSCQNEFKLAIRCFGACMWYLKDCLLDIQLISMGQFKKYVPADLEPALDDATACRFMILDGIAMTCLNIVGRGHTLERTLDKCCTSMGKRLLHQWICKPLCNVEEICQRQEAITELIKRPVLMQDARNVLKTLPDLERLISRIFSFGNGLRAQKHPDSRAILCEEKTYFQRKILDFIETLNGFEKAAELRDTFSLFESRLIVKYIGASAYSLFPDILETITCFKNSFNSKEGKMVLAKGIDEAYDKSLRDIERIQEELDDYLKAQQKHFKCEVSYFGTDKKRFQLDVPEFAAHKAKYRNYFLEGINLGWKSSKRYTTETTKRLLAEMIAAEAKSEQVLHDTIPKIFEKFSEKYEEWSLACHCLATIDVLISLAQYTKNQSVEMCVPQVLPFSRASMFELTEGYHPTLLGLIPNNINLGINGYKKKLILTGPNMGGKYLVFQKVALTVIMAQLGCYVPAKSIKLNLIDKIFTRLGIQDNTARISALAELREADVIIKHSTRNSLVLVEELGYGTGRLGSNAITSIYVEKLMKLNFRTIFSTHYCNVKSFLQENSCIRLNHMASDLSYS